MCLLLFLAALPALALDPSRNLDQFSYQTWQTGSGLPQNTVHSILQTKNGFLWLATEGGLARFDGFQFAVFDSRNTPALPSDNIRTLLEDSTGTLWIGTGDGLATFKADKFERIQLAAGTSILSLIADRKNGIWAVTPDAIIHRTPDGKTDTFTLPETSPRLSGAAANSHDGVLWLGAQTGLATFDNGQFHSAGIGLPAAPVNALLFDQAAKLWVGTSKGLFAADPRSARKFESAVGVPANESILALLEDQHGVIWAGTVNGCLRLGKRGGRILSNQGIVALAEDTEGDVWIGSEAQGITILRNQKFITFTTREGLADDAVRCVFEDRRGVLSIGTRAGLTQMQDGRFQPLTTANGLSSNVILSLGEDRDGALLVGTPDGLNRLQGNAVSVTTSADGLADDFVRSIYRDHDGSLWIGTRRGLSHEERPRHFKTYTQADGLGSELVGAMLRDQAGDLWVGTLHGLSSLHNGRFRNYGVKDGLSSAIITALYEDAEGDLWIGTQDAGLNLLHNGSFRHFAAKQGLPESIYGLVEDVNGELWIASKGGLVRVNANDLRDAAVNDRSSATVVWYGTSDGLRINECSLGGHPEVWRARDETIWFSTMKGAAAIYPSSGRLNRAPIPVALESITIDDRKFLPAEVDSIAPGHDRVVFEYAGLSFAAPQKVIYRYKLEGFDKDWVDAGAARVASYTNLPPGRFRFRVLARNSDGFWNEQGAAMSFRLQPHFYQTLWFYSLVALALAGASFAIYRWRVGEVEARFKAVLQERNRIGREIHDTLAQDIVGVSVQLEIVSRVLATSTETAREHLDQARLLVRESVAEARRSIWQLRSQSEESEDLASRLSKSAQQSAGLTPVKLSMEVRGTYRSIDRGVEDELLRIGQEAVTNALRHAKCRRIDIELAYVSKKLRMTIADDGCGFAPASSEPALNGHFGLQGMRERAAQIGARLTVASTPGKGTKVSVEAPLS